MSVDVWFAENMLLPATWFCSGVLVLSFLDELSGFCCSSILYHIEHATPIFRQLHWLPVQKRICHKIISATYRSVQEDTPLYLSDLLHRHTPSRLLRSASRSLLDVPGPRDSKTKRYGQRAFRYVVPSLWNVLPESIKEKDSIRSFWASLKTHLFT